MMKLAEQIQQIPCHKDPFSLVAPFKLLLQGKIKQQPCEQCGSEKSEMHQPFHKKTTFVVWLCRPCHLTLHKAIQLGQPPG